MKLKTLMHVPILALALAGTAAFAQAKLSDPQIAAIVVAANSVDIEAGKLAESKSSNAKVKEFAKRMVTDHTGVNKQATELVTKLGVKPEENETSRALKSGGDATLAKLKGLKGKEFDTAYANNEVTYHQAVLDTIDKKLLPDAQNAELKALIQKVRPAIADHLEHAKHLASSLK